MSFLVFKTLRQCFCPNPTPLDHAEGEKTTSATKTCFLRMCGHGSNASVTVSTVGSGCLAGRALWLGIDPYITTGLCCLFGCLSYAVWSSPLGNLTSNIERYAELGDKFTALSVQLNTGAKLLTASTDTLGDISRQTENQVTAMGTQVTSMIFTTTQLKQAEEKIVQLEEMINKIASVYRELHDMLTILASRSNDSETLTNISVNIRQQVEDLAQIQERAENRRSVFEIDAPFSPFEASSSASETTNKKRTLLSISLPSFPGSNSAPPSVLKSKMSQQELIQEQFKSITQLLSQIEHLFKVGAEEINATREEELKKITQAHLNLKEELEIQNSFLKQKEEMVAKLQLNTTRVLALVKSIVSVVEAIPDAKETLTKNLAYQEAKSYMDTM